jgi:lysophospholipase L1-like esterase
MKKRSPQHLVPALVLVLLAACGQSKMAPIPPGGTILSFGDSLTFGVGVETAMSYPSILAELTGRQVVNAGKSGEVTADGLRRLAHTLDETDPAVLILLEGGNDILRNEDPAVIRSNLAAMIAMAKSRGIEVVLVGVPEKNLFSRVAPFYEELAEEYQVVFEGELIGDMLRTASYKSDPLHFNRHGYRVLAEAIFELLTENGAI